MAQRAGWLVIALLGVLFIAGLALLGRDIHRLARTGPRWRRRFVGAGLALLSVLGVPACGETQDTTPATVKDDGKPATTLADACGWKRVVDTWSAAEETFHGNRGPYPIQRSARDGLVAGLDASVRDIEALEQHGLLGASQARLLTLDITRLKGKVAQMRVAGQPVLTCYSPTPVAYVVRSRIDDLSPRLALLRKIAAEEKLDPQVLAKVLASVEDDLRVLAEAEKAEGLPAQERERARELHKAVSDEVAKLKAAAGK